MTDLSILELGRAIRSGKRSSEAITSDALDRIALIDPSIHAFILVQAEEAMEQARKADAELRHGHDRGPMHGIPYAIKDIFDVAGLPTTCHSKIRLDHRADDDSAVATRLREAGAILLGKLATFEFAIGGPSFDLPFPPTRNPWNTDHICGGSSSGSAAAVAAGFVPMAVGSCTAGSIRGPAAWCGVVGLKPTYGRVSKHGVYPLSWSLDHCGPLSRTVTDAAIALQVMAGYDPRDPSSANVPVPDFVEGINGGVEGLRLGVPRHFFAENPAFTEEARAGIEASIDLLRQRGAVVEDVTLPDYADYLACNRIVMNAEMFNLHKETLQRRHGDYAENTRKRLLSGIGISASDYIDALRLRRALIAATNGVLHRYDGLVTAISLGTAPDFVSAQQPLSWALQASPFNVTGHPAMSVPVGLASSGLPLAVQIVGRHFDEKTVLRIGRAIERFSGWEQVAQPAL